MSRAATGDSTSINAPSEKGGCTVTEDGFIVGLGKRVGQSDVPFQYRSWNLGNLKVPRIDQLAQTDHLTQIAEELGIVVRREPIDGEGGGLCRIKGRTVLFIDTLADPASRLERCLEALAGVPGIDEHYLRPDSREQNDRIRARGQT